MLPKIGTAAWTIPKNFSHKFPSTGSHLERYSQVLNMVEINSSFYREHQAKTYARWASATPGNFKFSVKISKIFTHEKKLNATSKEIKQSLENILNLEKKLGVILIQLPGKLEFNLKNASRFYENIRKIYHGPLVIEPRNQSWLDIDAKQLMLDYKISKVIADPERCVGVDKKIFSAGGVTYYRMHGSPIIYKSDYSKKFLSDLATELKTIKNPWCVFDNTTFGYATGNAIELTKM